MKCCYRLSIKQKLTLNFQDLLSQIIVISHLIHEPLGGGGEGGGGMEEGDEQCR